VTNKVILIGFDMDGVLLPDHHYIEDMLDDQFFELLLKEIPLFNPTYDFDVVTARPEKFRPLTEKWLLQMTKQPNKLFMKETSLEETNAEYKFRIASQERYTIYVESDLQICHDMLKLVQKTNSALRIIHFGSWVQGSFFNHASYGFNDDWK
jgi:uncharacterized HAD superfamily protein